MVILEEQFVGCWMKWCVSFALVLSFFACSKEKREGRKELG